MIRTFCCIVALGFLTLFYMYSMFALYRPKPLFKHIYNHKGDPPKWIEQIQSDYKNNGINHYLRKIGDTISNMWDFIYKKISSKDLPVHTESEKLLKTGNGPYRALLTLFTSWTKNHNKSQIYQNTIEIWSQLYPQVQSIVFTNDSDTNSQLEDTSWRCLPVSRAVQGVPILKNMYLDAMTESPSYLYAYSNGDILFTSSLIHTLEAVLKFQTRFSNRTMFVVGQRTNVRFNEWQKISDQNIVEQMAKNNGTLYMTGAEDYFITSKDFPWNSIPDIIIGRRAYDNWLVLHANDLGCVTIDATKTILAVHQTVFSRGDMESRKNILPEYDAQLLRRKYGIINYGKGLTNNAKYYTYFDTLGRVMIQKKRLKLKHHM